MAEPEIQTTAETDSKSIFARAMDAVQKQVLLQSDGFTIDTGLTGKLNPGIPDKVPSIQTTIGTVPTESQVTEFKDFADSKHSNWTPLTLNRVLGESEDEYGRKRSPVSELTVLDNGGNLLHSEPIPQSRDGAISDFDIAKAAYKKLVTSPNASLSNTEWEAWEKWNNKIESVNKNVKENKDKLVAIRGYDDTGEMTSEFKKLAEVWHNPEYAMAVNRKNLDNFVSKAMGLEDNITLRRFLQENFNTGNPILEIGRRTYDWTAPLLEILGPWKWAVQTGVVNAGLQAESATDFFIKWNEGRDYRNNLKKTYLDAIDNNIGINLANVDMWND